MPSADLVVLRSWAQLDSAEPRLALRAKIVLLSAQGGSTTGVAQALGVSRPTVIEWRTRYANEGLAGLRDRIRPGRNPVVHDADVVVATVQRHAAGLECTAHAVAGLTGVSARRVSSVWRRWGLQPADDRLCLASDPRIAATVAGVLGVYLSRSFDAIALDCAGAASGIAAATTHAFAADPDAGAHAELLEAMSGVRAGMHRGADEDQIKSDLEHLLRFLKTIMAPTADAHVVIRGHEASSEAPIAGRLARSAYARVVHYVPEPMWLPFVDIAFRLASAARGSLAGQSVSLLAELRRYADEPGSPLSWIPSTDGLPTRAGRNTARQPDSIYFTAAPAFEVGNAEWADGPLRRPKASDVIARRIVDLILGGDLQPGARLPSERDMMTAMHASRTTVREALRLLETRGVITVRPGPQGGPIVRRPRSTDLTEALTLILRFQGSTPMDVLQSRQLLEPALTREAASRITPAELDVLRDTVAQMLDRVDRYDIFIEANRVFHSTIAAASGNGPSVVFMDTLKNIGDGSIAGVRANQERRLEVARAHQQIVAALSTRDATRSEAAMRAHLKDSARYWSHAYSPLIFEPLRWVR